MTQPGSHDDTYGQRPTPEPPDSGHNDCEHHREQKREHRREPDRGHCGPDCSESTIPAARPDDRSDPAVAVRDCVGESDFQHWFAKRSRFLLNADQLLIEVPNPFILNWLMKRFRTDLGRAARRLLGPSGSFQLRVNADLQLPAARGGNASRNGDGDSPGAHSGDRPERPAAGDPRPVAPAHHPVVGASARSRRRFRSFDSFVTGDSNELAVLAARQITGNPGNRFNPLYLFGGTGTGKTHLLEAIYSEVRRNQRQLNVVYLTSEGFTNYFTSALSGRTIPSFRQRFRNVDVLLIDNVEFLDNKRATQEEFLHTMVQIIEHGGHVVISSDRHPRMLTRHREELTTRFQSGLLCRIEPPDDALRQQLTRSIASSLSADFTDDALDYVARKCRRNVRELQGAMNSLDGYYALTRRRITVPVARDVLGDLVDESRRLVRISDVERVICEAFGVTATELRSRTRRKAVSLPRSLAMFISRKLTHSAYREIGLYFGGRDHSTVVAAERRVLEWIAADEPLRMSTSCSGRTIRDVVDELENRLRSLAS